MQYNKFDPFPFALSQLCNAITVKSIIDLQFYTKFIVGMWMQNMFIND